MPLNEVAYFFQLAFLSVFVGGIAALLGGAVFGLFTGTLMTGILAIAVAVLIIYMYKFTEVDGLRFAEWVVLLLILGGFGTLITNFVPSASAFILSSASFTVSGLGFTVLYVLVADAIGDKVF